MYTHTCSLSSTSVLKLMGKKTQTPFSKWFVQYDILNIISFQTNFSTYSTLLDKYSEIDLYL
jgi:hypothetical protein